MDTMMKIIDTIGTSIDCVFIGYCRCVSHCFKFVQLLGMIMECIIGVITTLLHYNNIFFSTLLNFISNLTIFIREIPPKVNRSMAYVLNEIIIGVPVAVMNFISESVVYMYTNFKKNLYEDMSSIGTYCQVVLPLVGNMFLNLAVNICSIPYKLLHAVYDTGGDSLESCALLVQSVFAWLVGIVTSCYTTIVCSLELTITNISGMLLTIKSILENVLCLPKSIGTYIISMLSYFLLKLHEVLSIGLYSVLDLAGAVSFNVCRVAESIYSVINIDDTINLILLASSFVLIRTLYFNCTAICEFIGILLLKSKQGVIRYLEVLNHFFGILFLMSAERVMSYLQVLKHFFGILFLMSEEGATRYLEVLKHFFGLLLLMIEEGVIRLEGLKHFFGVLFLKSKEGVIHYLEVLKHYFRLLFRITPSNSNVDVDCVVCQDNEKTVVLMPCRHLCLCIICYRRIMRMGLSKRVCPICRVRIDDFISVFM